MTDPRTHLATHGMYLPGYEGVGVVATTAGRSSCPDVAASMHRYLRAKAAAERVAA